MGMSGNNLVIGILRGLAPAPGQVERMTPFAMMSPNYEQKLTNLPAMNLTTDLHCAAMIFKYVCRN